MEFMSSQMLLSIKKRGQTKFKSKFKFKLKISFKCFNQVIVQKLYI